MSAKPPKTQKFPGQGNHQEIHTVKLKHSTISRINFGQAAPISSKSWSKVSAGYSIFLIINLSNYSKAYL